MSLAQRIMCLAPGNTDEPGQHARTALKATRTLPYGHQRILKQFFSQAIIWRKLKQIGKQGTLVTHIKLGKRLPISASNPLNQLAIISERFSSHPANLL